jgi:hypothetical protein
LWLLLLITLFAHLAHRGTKGFAFGLVQGAVAVGIEPPQHLFTIRALLLTTALALLLATLTALTRLCLLTATALRLTLFAALAATALRLTLVPLAATALRFILTLALLATLKAKAAPFDALGAPLLLFAHLAHLGTKSFAFGLVQGAVAVGIETPQHLFTIRALLLTTALALLLATLTALTRLCLLTATALRLTLFAALTATALRLTLFAALAATALRLTLFAALAATALRLTSTLFVTIAGATRLLLRLRAALPLEVFLVALLGDGGAGRKREHEGNHCEDLFHVSRVYCRPRAATQARA